MATNTPLKSILKKANYPATSATASKEARDRETALFHANLIQQRKDIELEIVLSIEQLIEFPLATAPHDAANPAPADASAFKKHLRNFQPSDYESLIEERNIDKKCGYTLCANPRPVETGGGFRLIGTNNVKDFRVVPKKELERWCSPACAKRALYVKVQLNESPAWERQSQQADVDLLDEPKSEDGSITSGLQNLQLSEHDILHQNAADLALERGDIGRAAIHGKVKVDIQEKQVSDNAEPPSLGPQELSDQLRSLHLAVEGYKSNFDPDKAIKQAK